MIKSDIQIGAIGAVQASTKPSAAATITVLNLSLSLSLNIFMAVMLGVSALYE